MIAHGFGDRRGAGAAVKKREFIGWLRGAVLVTLAALLITQACNAGVFDTIARRLGLAVPAKQEQVWPGQKVEDPRREREALRKAYAEQPQPEVQSVSYFDADNAIQTVNDVTLITENTQALSNGWYATAGDIKLPDGLTVYGEVNLVLGKGKLYLGKAIDVPAGSTLRIYCTPEDEMGEQLSAVFTDRVINNHGVLEIYGGSIGNGAATAVYNQGTFTMYGGLITGCYNNAVCNLESGAFRMLGGAIAGNARAGVVGTGTLAVAGTPVIEENAGGDVVLGRAVVVDENSAIDGCDTIYVEGKLGRGTRIGITAEDFDKPITRGFAEHNKNVEPGNCFFSDYEGVMVVADESGEALLDEPQWRK